MAERLSASSKVRMFLDRERERKERERETEKKRERRERREREKREERETFIWKRMIRKRNGRKIKCFVQSKNVFGF